MAPPDFSALRAELALPDDFPADVLVEAERLAAVPPHAPEDLTDVPFVTLDPPGSMDLDQAVHLEVTEDGWRVQYAIADLGAVITLDGVIDAEARRRGQTVYLPDARVPLHPPVLSEGALSLLPDQVRRAAVWTIDVARDGTLGEARVRRALVKSVARLDYAGVQADFDSGRPHPSIAALLDLGLARRAARIAAGAVELGLPEQEADVHDGVWSLTWRRPIACEGANAEVSLLTGMSAARLMVDAKIGVLRTLPDPSPEDVAGFLARATSVGLAKPGQTPAQVLDGLSAKNPVHLALMNDATALLRGAGYAAFDGTLPEVQGHAGVGATYAHVTAPLRRLVDRFGTEVCLALSAGEQVPDGLRAALTSLPELMATSDQRASKANRMALDLVEASLLSDRVGQDFEAFVVRADGTEAQVMIEDPAVLTHVPGRGLREGERVTVRLESVDPAAGKTAFSTR